jgi:hypothetical protein
VTEYTVVNASEWPLERIAPHMSAIMEEMGRLAARFPGDMTMATLLAEFLTGKKTLWLVLNEGAFVSIALTSIRTIDATGTRLATLNDLAGRDVDKYAPELCAALEQWAADNNAQPEIYGRKGWEPLLRNFGYRPFATLYRKAA